MSFIFPHVRCTCQLWVFKPDVTGLGPTRTLSGYLHSTRQRPTKHVVVNAYYDDATLQSPLRSPIVHTLTGWPNYDKDVPESLKAFFNVRSLLSVSNGLLTYTDRMVIPIRLRPDIPEKIHTGHQGITECL